MITDEQRAQAAQMARYQFRDEEMHMLSLGLAQVKWLNAAGHVVLEGYANGKYPLDAKTLLIKARTDIFECLLEEGFTMMPPGMPDPRLVLYSLDEKNAQLRVELEASRADNARLQETINQAVALLPSPEQGLDEALELPVSSLAESAGYIVSCLASWRDACQEMSAEFERVSAELAALRPPTAINPMDAD